MRKTGKKRMTLIIISAVCFIALYAIGAVEAQKLSVEQVNVFAVVSDNIEQAFYNAGKALKESEGISSFPIENFQIHCTLYMTRYSTEQKKALLQKVENIASSISEFETNTTGLEITSGNWFFMNLVRNRNLQTLSDLLVESLSPFRTKSDFIPDWAKAYPKKVEYISKYGSPNVYGEFNPHLTFLARADGDKLHNFVKKYKSSPFSQNVKGKIIAIGIGIADKNGQIKNPWKIFPLKPDEK